MKTLKRPLAIAAASFLALPACAEIVEFDELKVLIEINATDGDIGFHALLDADPWRHIRMDDPDGQKLLNIRAFQELRMQGVTENFFESSEPPCEPDEEEPDAPTQTLAEFIDKFAAGEYWFRAVLNEGDLAIGSAELTYNIPAAPDIDLTDEGEFPLDDVFIMWEPGDDLGEGCHDQDLIDDGVIADPATVELTGWEVVVEVDEDGAPARVFSAQLPPEQTFVMVPVEFLQPFLDLGFTTFKFEVGAIEESGNQTFSEGEFEIAD